MKAWWRKYWPWLLPFGFLIVYELVAIALHQQTLSQKVWQAQLAWSPLVWIVTIVVIVLWVHFFIRRRR